MELNMKEVVKDLLHNSLMVFFGLTITIMVMGISLMALILFGASGGAFTFGMCLTLISFLPRKSLMLEPPSIFFLLWWTVLL